MFEKLIAIEPISLMDWAEKKLNSFAKEVVMFKDIPQGADEIVNRIGDADAVLLSYTTTLDKEILERCPNIKYIGMCCSLYSPESANVDIIYAKTHDIVVTGIRDYGDEGVVEYVVSELVRCLHGFETSPDGTKIAPWNGVAEEITGLKCGIIGLGKLGGMIADALSFFGATIDYVARSEKENAAKKGYKFVPINDLMASNEVVICCLNKNTVLLHEKEFDSFGNHKILFNVGLSRAWDEKPFTQWLSRNNRVYCDSPGALGNEELQSHPNVRLMNVSAGRTRQAFDRLSEKVLENLSEYNGRGNIA